MRTARPVAPPPSTARVRLFAFGAGVTTLAGLFVVAGPVLALPARSPEHYRFTRWGMEDGLPHDRVNALVQTPDGYLWIGTAYGLARYDGGGFTVFDGRNTPVLRDRSISALKAGRDGGLWIGTSRGVVLHERGVFSLPGLGHAVEREQVTSIAEDRDGRLWVGTLHGVYRLDAGQWESFGVDDGLPHGYVLWLLVDSRGTLWAGTWAGGLARWERGAFVTHRRLGGGGIQALFEGSDGSLWVGNSEGGLWRLNADGEDDYWSEADGLGGSVVSILEDRDANLWIGTGAGLQSLNGDGLSPPDSRVTGSVLALLEDREGNVWMGSRSDGLARLVDVSFVTYGPLQGLPKGEVSAVLEDSAGDLWIAASGGLTRWNEDGLWTITTADGLNHDSVLSLAEGIEGVIWVGTAQGVNKIRSGVVSRPQGLAAVATSVWSMATTADGALWIGGFDSLYRYLGGRLEVISAPGPHPGSVVSALDPDPVGEGLWIGTLGAGLLRYDAAGLREAEISPRLPSRSVYAMHRSEDGSLWIGTGGGLARVRDDEVTSYAEPLYQGPIFRILEDDAGWLWCSSAHGVFRVDRASLDAVARGEATAVRFRLFGTADGLASSECTGGAQPAGWRGRDGRLWFPTLKGLAAVDPASVVWNEVPPLVQLRKVVVDGDALSAEAPLSIAPGATKFEFHYAGLSLRAPERVRFRYKLEGLDDDWVNAGSQRIAHYMNLPAGGYRFVVQAANEDGVWCEDHAEVGLTLAPHFYMTFWFGTVVVVIGVVSLGALYRRHRRKVEQEFSAVIAERGRMARELHDTLAQGLAGISIQLEVVEETLASDPPVARSHLDRARRMVRISLADARRSVFNLRPRALENGDLPEALSRVVRNITLEQPVSAELKVIGSPRPLPSSIENNLLRIAQEALTNTMRHAAARSIRIELRFDRYEVALRLADDGRGFDPAEAFRDQEDHLGLVGMRERVEEIEGTFDVRSAPGDGTEVFVLVPVR